LNKKFTFVTAVNDDIILQNNLMKSPCIYKHNINVIVKIGYDSAGESYNDALNDVDTEYIIFCHQDMYFPNKWLDILNDNIKILNNYKQPGVIGCFGVDKGGDRHGLVYSNGLKRKLGGMDKPREVMCLDEIVLVTKKSHKIYFDPHLLGFHLYGTDLCLNSISKGYTNYAISNPCIHNSVRYNKLPKEFWKSYNYISKKWHEFAPFNTSVTKIEKYKIKQEWVKMKSQLGYIIRNNTKSLRHDNPEKLFFELELEKLHKS